MERRGRLSVGRFRRFSGSLEKGGTVRTVGGSEMPGLCWPAEGMVDSGLVWSVLPVSLFRTVQADKSGAGRGLGVWHTRKDPQNGRQDRPGTQDGKTAQAASWRFSKAEETGWSRASPLAAHHPHPQREGEEGEGEERLDDLDTRAHLAPQSV